MTAKASANEAQVEYWNTKGGGTWVKFQEALDRQIEPLGLAAMNTLKPEKGEHILDIGCGCGQTSVELASRVGDAGSVLGVDISKPMLEVARQRPLPARSMSRFCCQVKTCGLHQYRDGAALRLENGALDVP